MASSFNKCILLGNVTRDPEMRYTPKGTAGAKISMAVNRTWKTETGEKKEEVTFVDVDAFGKQAEVIAQYVKKGNPLLIEGRLKLDQWEDKQTKQKRSKLGVALEGFTLLGGGKKEQQPARQQAPAQGAPDDGQPEEAEPPF